MARNVYLKAQAAEGAHRSSVVLDMRICAYPIQLGSGHSLLIGGDREDDLLRNKADCRDP